MVSTEATNSRAMSFTISGYALADGTKKLEEMIGSPVDQREVRAMLRPIIEPPSIFCFKFLSEFVHHRLSWN